MAKLFDLRQEKKPFIAGNRPKFHEKKRKQTKIANINGIPLKLPKERLELKNKRTSYSTRYLNNDGSFTEEIFLEQKFYKDPTDGEWREVDNNLKPSLRRVDKFENTANDFSVFFAEKSGGQEIFTLEKDEKSIEFLPIDANTTKAVRKNNEIQYDNIYPGVNIAYSVRGRRIKEDIIINQYMDKNVFSYELKFNGLDILLDKDRVYFVDGEEQKHWYMEKPFMVDAKGRYSDEVNMTLRNHQGKTYLDVTVDESFLKDPDTQYPVTIDPTIDGAEILRDTFVASKYPSTSYSSLNKFYTGADPYYYGTMRPLVRFALPSIPSDSRILSASFNAYQTKQDTTSSTIDLYRVEDTWSDSVSWDTQPSIGTTREATVTESSYNQYWNWSITQLAKDWYNGVQPNYGFMLKQQNEDTAPFRTFNTVDIGVNTPKLTITYWIDPIGYEDFWSYTKDDVNPANGNLVLKQTDYFIPGRGFPVSITRVYNSRKSHVAAMFGYGWRTNFEAFIVDAGEGPITLVDGDSTRHIFGESINGGYVAYDGIYLDLQKNTDGTYTITDKDGTKTHFDTSGKITSIVDTNGNRTLLNYTDGRLASIQDASGRITSIYYGTNGYVSSVVDPAQRITAYEYDTLGNLINVTDPEGKVMSFGYDTNHNIISITDERSITTSITYDANDTVTSISRPITIDGVTTTSTTTYVYDFNNSVTQVTDGEGKLTEYHYSPSKNLRMIVENPLDTANRVVTTLYYTPDNNLAKVIDPNSNRTGSTTEYTFNYDDAGNVTKVQIPENQIFDYAYDGGNNLIEENDSKGYSNVYDYNNQSNPTEATDPNLQTAASRYLANGNIDYETRPIAANDNLILNSSFEIGETWPINWTATAEPTKTAIFAWANEGKYGNKSISISDPTGWALVSAKSVVHQLGTKYVVSGFIKTVGTTNTANLKIEFSDSDGSILAQQFSYGLKGNHDWTRVHAVVDEVPAGTVRVIVSASMNPGTGTAYFDGIQLERGTVVSNYNLIDNGSFEVNSDTDSIPDLWTTTNNLTVNDGIYTEISEDDDLVYEGTKSFKLTGEAGINKYIKQRVNISGDANTKLTLSGWSRQEGANPSGGYYGLQIAINYTDDNKTVDWDNANNFSTTDEGWQHVAAEVIPKQAFDSIDVYCYYYNQTGTAWFDAMRLELSNAITEYVYDDRGNYITKITNPVGNTTTFSYDDIGNQTRVEDGNNNITLYSYDNRNLLTQVTNAKGHVTQYGYDDAGNRTTVINARNKMTTYSYNEFNQVSQETNPLNQTTQFGYNKNGNLTKKVTPKGDEVGYSYNDVNRRTSKAYNGVTKWQYDYDANGNLINAIEVPSGQNITYNYDTSNRLIKKEKNNTNSISYNYDLNSNITEKILTAGITLSTHSYVYNPLNRVVKLIRNGSNLEQYVYDEFGNVISKKRGNITYTSYEYDDAGRLKAIINYNPWGSVVERYEYIYDANGNRTSVITQNGTINYQYNSLNQLAQETLLDGSIIDYRYDAVGNRIEKVVTRGAITTTTNYTYNDGDELVSVDNQLYTYDANGNLVSNGEKTFIYDVENRLMEIKDSSGNTIATFTYDYEGKRTSKTTASGNLYFHYDQNNRVVYETDNNNNIVAEYTYDPLGNPATMTRDGQTYFYHVNGHGDVMSMTDINGVTVAQYSYDAWGNILSQSGIMAALNPLRYAGYRYDEATGLYYLMARYYDPQTGRFITRDSFEGLVNDPLSLNDYLYARSNPVKYVDPTGRAYISRYYWWGYRVTMTNSDVNKALGLLAMGAGAATVASAIPGAAPITVAIAGILGIYGGGLVYLNHRGKGIYIYRLWTGKSIWARGIA